MFGVDRAHHLVGAGGHAGQRRLRALARRHRDVDRGPRHRERVRDRPGVRDGQGGARRRGRARRGEGEIRQRDGGRGDRGGAGGRCGRARAAGGGAEQHESAAATDTVRIHPSVTCRESGASHRVSPLAIGPKDGAHVRQTRRVRYPARGQLSSRWPASIKKDAKRWALVIRCMDLTALAGDETAGQDRGVVHEGGAAEPTGRRGPERGRRVPVSGVRARGGVTPAGDGRARGQRRRRLPGRSRAAGWPPAGDPRRRRDGRGRGRHRAEPIPVPGRAATRRRSRSWWPRGRRRAPPTSR